jgi:hypothetical protein
MSQPQQRQDIRLAEWAKHYWLDRHHSAQGEAIIVVRAGRQLELLEVLCRPLLPVFERLLGRRIHRLSQ